MAGTYAEQATLASDNAFVALCRVSLLKRAKEMTDDTTKQTVEEINFYYNLLINPDNYATRLAWLIATNHPTISAAAPVLPSDAVAQAAVNATLNYLLRT